MNVLHVIASMDPALGGVCQAVRHMVQALNVEGIESDTVSLDMPERAFIKQSDINITPLGPAHTPWQYSSRLRKWLRCNLARFDVVIIHGLWLYTGYGTIREITGFKQRWPGHKLICFVMPHGMLDPYFQKAKERKLKALRNLLFYKFFERHVINDADALLFTCTEELRLAANSFLPYRPKKTIVTGLGIPTPPPLTIAMTNAFYNSCFIPPGEPFLLFLGRIHEKKGVDLLVRSYAKLAAQANQPVSMESLPGDRTNSWYSGDALPHLVIAGPGFDTPYGKQVLQLIQGHPEVNGKVHTTGMLQGDAKWGAYYNCQAFVLCSHQENFGISVTEAMACGKPVLISNNVNIWREISNNGAGMVSKNDVSEISELLKQWLRLENEERNRMQNQALNTFHETFSITAFARKMKEVITINLE